MSPNIQKIRSEELKLAILKANYDILIGFVTRWAIIEREGYTNLSSEVVPLALKLSEETIPSLRLCLGLAPDPSLSSLAGEIRARISS